MAELAIAAAVVGAGGKMMQGYAAKKEGRATQDSLAQAAEYQAQGLTRRAGEERAASQREAGDERLKADRVSSEAITKAAASGGGIDNPTILDILSGIEGQGEYLAASKLYGGNSRSAGLLDQAATGKYDAAVKGRAAREKGDAAFVGSIFEGVGQIGTAAAGYARTGSSGSTSSIPDISGDPDDGWKVKSRSYR